jgi:hypothetical protein
MAGEKRISFFCMLILPIEPVHAGKKDVRK